MKKVISTIIMLVIFLCGCLTIFNNEKSDKLKKITVAEVAHTIFYAPSYIAISEGFFENNGIDIDLILTPGADKVAASVLSGDADIGLSGSEACIYVYNANNKDYLKTFSQLTQKDGSFLVSRKKINNFKLEDLKGKKVIGGRPGGMPEMTFEYALRKNNINPKKDLEIDTSIAFPAMGGSFISGNGDFVTLFEPTALEIENKGYGYVVASIGELGGIVPYTSYSAKKSYIENNKELIKKFDDAIQKGLDFVHKNNNKKIAESILEFFPDTSLKDLEKVIERYKKIDAWPKTTKFTEESFNNLQNIMISSNELKNKVNFNKLIYQID